MTDEELAQIRARVEAATPGPWRCWNGYELRRPVMRQPNPDASPHPDMAMGRIGPEVPFGSGITATRPFDDIRALRPDAEFVAHAREDVPALLAEVEQLRATLERERADHASCEDTNARRFAALQDGITRIADENAAMREVVQAVAQGCTMAIRPNATWCAACLCLDNTDGEWSDSPHDADCCVTKARAILATEQQRTEVRGEPAAE